MTAGPLDQPPTRPPRIEDDGELARGGMSSIRRIRDTLLQRTAAMKVLDPALAAVHPRLETRFLREAQLLAQLDHPHIVPLYELSRDDRGTPCFTMKLVEGETLADHIHDDDPTEDHRGLQRVLEIIIKVCDALAFAHGRGVIHRDLKPENVMVGSHGQVYVMDWGVARLLSAAQLVEAGVAVEAAVRCDRGLEDDGAEDITGTPGYMAPEQAWGRHAEIDQRTDVFGVGGLIYAALTGRPPYVADDPMAQLELARRAQIRPPHELAPGRVPAPGLSRVAMRALAPDRAARYPTIDALRADLERLLRGGVFEPRSFAAGSEILREHDAGDAAYIIARGTCEATRVEAGRAVMLRQMTAGDVFGEMALLTGAARSATVRAVDDVTVLTVTRPALEEWLGLDSGLGRLVLSLADRFRDVDSQLVALRRDHLKLYVREQLLTAVIGRGRVAWAPLCAWLVGETGLTEVDLIAIASDYDDLELDAGAKTLTLIRR